MEFGEVKRLCRRGDSKLVRQIDLTAVLLKGVVEGQEKLGGGLFLAGFRLEVGSMVAVQGVTFDG